MQSDNNLSNQGSVGDNFKAIVPATERTPTDVEALSELTWAVMDENATEEDLQTLEKTLLESKAAREEFINMTLLHADLDLHFRGLPDLPPIE